MTDKEFKRLSRSQLIDIIYQLQIKQDELTAENEKLRKVLADRRLRVANAGNIAEAALEIHNVMQSAQEAADRYMEEIRQMQTETKEACRQALDKAREEAVAIIEQATKSRSVYDLAVESILKEYEQNEQ